MSEPIKKNEPTPIDAAKKAAKTKSWVTKFEIGKGEWLIATKPQLESLMRPTYQFKVRVYAAGLLHAAGYKDEKAWKQIRVAGELKTVPYNPIDIVNDLNNAMERYFKESGVALTVAARKSAKATRQHVRRALAFLESAGAAERRLKDGTPVRDLPLETRRNLNQGIHLYFFCRPKPASETQAKRLLDLLEGCSPRWPKMATSPHLESVAYAIPTLKKLKIDYLLKALLEADPEVVNTDYLKRELKVGIEGYQKAIQVVNADYKKRFEVAMESSHIESIGRESKPRERKGPQTDDSRTPEETVLSLSGPGPEIEPSEPPERKSPAPPFDPKPSWETFWHLYTKGHDYGEDARKIDAWLWWKANVSTDVQAADIIEGLNRHIESASWIDGIGVPYAVNFLTNRRYQEHPKPGKKKATTPAAPLPDMRELRERFNADRRKRNR